MVDRLRKNATHRAWCHKNKEKVNSINDTWRKNNPDKVKAKDKRYRDTNQEKINSGMRERRKRLFQEILDHYGHACQVCGSTTNPCIDHIGGHLEGPKNGPSLWAWLKNGNFPPGFRTLCRDHNTLDGLIRADKYFGVKGLGISGIDSLVRIIELLKNK